ncbi:MAG: hypothetical protein ACI4D7_03480 [Lachnospiraceae bacterium]
MANFDGFGAFIRTNSKKAVDTAKEVANVTKIKADIKAEELKMDSVYVAIGKLFCKLAAGEIDPEFIPLLQKIADSKEKISNLQAELDTLKKSVTCPECGKKSPIGSRFCNACGADLTVADVTGEKVAETDEVDMEDDIEDGDDVTEEVIYSADEDCPVDVEDDSAIDMGGEAAEDCAADEDETDV